MNKVELYSSAWYGDVSMKIEFPPAWDVSIVGNNVQPTLNDESIKGVFLRDVFKVIIPYSSYGG